MTDARRSVFDGVADLYERVRPTYPAALTDDLITLSGVPVGGRILEIGCGTGQLTLPLARLGYHIDAIELGPSLAAVARRNLAAFPSVAIHEAAFEEWPLPREPFDLVVSATAFHWLDRKVRFEKAARVLKPAGALAVIDTQHVSGRDDAFFAEVQECYERHMPGTPPGLRLTNAAAISPQLDGPGVERFAEPAIRTYPREIAYTTEEYLDVLRTYSSHILLTASEAAALYACIQKLADGRYEGRVRKQYLFTLVVAFIADTEQTSAV